MTFLWSYRLQRTEGKQITFEAISTCSHLPISGILSSEINLLGFLRSKYRDVPIVLFINMFPDIFIFYNMADPKAIIMWKMTSREDLTFIQSMRNECSFNFYFVYSAWLLNRIIEFIVNLKRSWTHYSWIIGNEAYLFIIFFFNVRIIIFFGGGGSILLGFCFNNLEVLLSLLRTINFYLRAQCRCNLEEYYYNSQPDKVELNRRPDTHSIPIFPQL